MTQVIQHRHTMTNAHCNDTLPSPAALKSNLPATPKLINTIQHSRDQIASILLGKDKRLLLIVGPCSIHDISSAMEYAEKLKQLRLKYQNTFYFVMRTYFEKPRTALGWKGMLYDPHLNGTDDLVAGLQSARSLLLQLTEMEIPAATEFLDPSTPQYIGDLISWACIGARTVESQIHREIASGLSMPISFKNSTSGNVNVAINAVLSASSPHACFAINDNGHISIKRTKGNPCGHITLRGGDGKPNYDAKSIATALEQLKANKLNEGILVDCSHDNSCRNFEEQSTVFQNTLQQYLDGNTAIRGLILESHLNSGSQNFTINSSPLKYGVSITDSCLDWAATEDLISMAAKKLGNLSS